METKLIKESKNLTVIEWREGKQFGQVVIRYNGRGGYTVDAEYIGMEKLIRIIKSI